MEFFISYPLGSMDTNHEPQKFHTNGKQKKTYFYKLAHTFAQSSQSHHLPCTIYLVTQPHLHCNIFNTNIIIIFPTTSNKPLKKNHKCPNNYNTSHDIRTTITKILLGCKDKNSKVTITSTLHQMPKTHNL